MDREVALADLSVADLGPRTEVYAIGDDDVGPDASVLVGPQPLAPFVNEDHPGTIMDRLFIRVRKLDAATLQEVRDQLMQLRADKA